MADFLVDALRDIVGTANVLTDADVRASYEVDWLGKYRGTARCVVRPATVAEVSAVVRECAASGARIVPQGGNTGLVGGSVPRGNQMHGEVVLSTHRLTSLGEVDVPSHHVLAGAGITIETLQQHARAAGLDFAVDWGARASATVGGAVSTNAGGSRVVRFGTMRSQVMGLQMVLADGSVVDETNGLPKETTGPRLSDLVVASEGTLAVVTAARLRLVPWYRHTAAALVACTSLADAVALLPTLRSLPSLDAVEVLMADALRVACAHLGITPPLAHGAAFVLVDCAAMYDPSDELAATIGHCDGVMATGPQRDELFRIRDHVTIAISALGTPVKLDVAVPLHQLDELVRRVDRVAATTNTCPIVFGHLAEGNLHVNLLNARDARDAADITTTILGAAIELGGTISAEHGVGIAKVAWLEQVKGTASVAALRAVKRALDPEGLFNPGVLWAE